MAKTRRLGIQEMREIAKARRGRCLSTEYVNAGAKLLWQCVKGHKWEAVPGNVKNGSWCPHCQEAVPRVMKVDERLKGSRIRFEYYGLPYKFSKDPETSRAKITHVPTAVVFRGGWEIGRLAGNRPSRNHWTRRRQLRNEFGITQCNSETLANCGSCRSRLCMFVVPLRQWPMMKTGGWGRCRETRRP